MQPEPFLTPKLTGGRFKGGGLPLEVMGDFAVLSKLLTAVARQRFLDANPDRTRVKRGFAQGFSLVLTEIRSGSVEASIGCEFPGRLFAEPERLEHLTRSKEAVVGAMRAAFEGRDVSPYLTKKQLGYFAGFGRSLKDGEAIEFRETPEAPPVRFTKELRRKLVSGRGEEFDEKVEWYCGVHELDHERRTCKIKTLDGAKYEDVHFPHKFHETLNDAAHAYPKGTKVRIEAVAAFESDGKFKAVKKLEEVEILDPRDVRLQIRELKLLREGWLDGEDAPPPSPAGLDWLESAFEAGFEYELPLPYVFPTPDGDVQFEWDGGNGSLIVEIDLERKSADWRAKQAGERRRGTFDLSAAEGWAELSDRVRAEQTSGHVQGNEADRKI